MDSNSQTSLSVNQSNLNTKLEEVSKNGQHRKLLNSSEPKDGEIIKNVQACETRVDKNTLPVWICYYYGDVFVLYLRGKSQEIQWLENDILEYSNDGQHFTNQYRILEGHCEKLQADLDKVDVYGRDDLREIRKQLLTKMADLFKVLSEKAHISGRTCPECNTKN